jgi:hypothetical protein
MLDLLAAHPSFSLVITRSGTNKETLEDAIVGYI